jgi:murein DD-endopeptidase MepM/ murein hydrolase activator NlpD
MSDEKGRNRHLTIMVVPEGAPASRTFRLTYGRLRLLSVAGVVVALSLTLMAGSWWYLAARASRVAGLEQALTRARADSTRVEALGRRLDQIERQYGQIRHLFGSTPEAPSDLWLPPAEGGRRRTPSPASRAENSRPTSWPLTESGFVTQGLLEGADGRDHPGLDIAVPADSYIRAAGAGTVVDVGEDPVYGRYVVIDHGDGYTSLYGHASLTLVTRGEHVRQNEVIALSGSTGQSTAPHLHFEILHNGKAVDPLTMVTQP